MCMENVSSKLKCFKKYELFCVIIVHSYCLLDRKCENKPCTSG